MIILHNNKNKIYFTFFLALLSFLGVIVLWSRLSVSSQAAPTMIDNSQNSNPSVFQEVQNSLELSKLQWNELQNKLVKDRKQQELLAAAKEYLNNKLSSTSTSTTVSTSTATTSIK